MQMDNSIVRNPLQDVSHVNAPTEVSQTAALVDPSGNADCSNWLSKFRAWLPGFLDSKYEGLKEGEAYAYPLCSLKLDFQAQFKVKMDHVSLGYPKLTDFIRCVPELCQMRIVPGPSNNAIHAVLFPVPAHKRSSSQRTRPPARNFTGSLGKTATAPMANVAERSLTFGSSSVERSVPTITSRSHSYQQALMGITANPTPGGSGGAASSGLLQQSTYTAMPSFSQCQQTPTTNGMPQLKSHQPDRTSADHPFHSFRENVPPKLSTGGTTISCSCEIAKIMGEPVHKMYATAAGSGLPASSQIPASGDITDVPLRKVPLPPIARPVRASEDTRAVFGDQFDVNYKTLINCIVCGGSYEELLWLGPGMFGSGAGVCPNCRYNGLVGLPPGS